MKKGWIENGELDRTPLDSPNLSEISLPPFPPSLLCRQRRNLSCECEPKFEFLVGTMLAFRVLREAAVD